MNSKAFQANSLFQCSHSYCFQACSLTAGPSSLQDQASMLGDLLLASLLNPSIIHRVTSTKRNCKEHGNPTAKEALGEGCHWNQPWNTTGWRRKGFMRDRQAGILGFTFYKSLKGVSWYSMFTFSIFIHVFERGYCHKGIKQGKADNLQHVIYPTSPPHTWVLSLSRDAKSNSQ